MSLLRCGQRKLSFVDVWSAFPWLIGCSHSEAESGSQVRSIVAISVLQTSQQQRGCFSHRACALGPAPYFSGRVTQANFRFHSDSNISLLKECQCQWSVHLSFTCGITVSPSLFIAKSTFGSSSFQMFSMGKVMKYSTFVISLKSIQFLFFLSPTPATTTIIGRPYLQ